MEWTRLCQDRMNQNYGYYFALVGQLYIKSSLSLIVYLFLKNCSSQFFSNWKSAEPVFCSEELSHLPYKNQNQNLTLSFGEGKFKFAVLWGLFIKSFFHWATFSKKKNQFTFFLNFVGQSFEEDVVVLSESMYKWPIRMAWEKLA